MKYSDEERRQRILDKIERFRVMDDTFMRLVFRDNLPLTQHVLRVLTSATDLTLIKQETQRDMLVAVGSKSGYFDVWSESATGSKYDLEVQTGYSQDPLRFGYYCACMKIDAIPSGKEYSRLPEVWVIVVLEHGSACCDEGRALYEMRNACREENLGDGGHILYVDASYRGDNELGSLMADFCESDPDKIVDGLLRERVQYLKRSPEGVKLMCKISEELFNEGFEQGIEQGIEQGAERTILGALRSMMLKLRLTPEQALDVLGVARDEWSKYLALV